MVTGPMRPGDDNVTCLCIYAGNEASGTPWRSGLDYPTVFSVCSRPS